MPVTLTGRESIGSYEKEGVLQRTRKIRVDNVYLNLDSSRIESVSLRPPRTNENNASETDEDSPF